MATIPIPGPPPDFESRGGSVIAAAVTTVVIAAIFVGLRFFTRWSVARRSLGLSDCAILIALVFSIGNSIATILGVTLGPQGQHFTAALTTPERFLAGAKAGYATTICYIVSLVSVKLSILLLYLRILRPTTIHRLCCGVIALVSVLTAWTLVSSIVACVPVEAIWDPFNHPDAWCFPGPPKWWSDLGIHIFTELVILALPARFIYSLNVARGQKLGLYALFAFGTIVCIVSLLRVPSLYASAHSADPTWDSAAVAIWSCVELNIAIICACCMTLRPLLARIFPRLLSSGYRQHSDEPPMDPGQFPPTVGSRKERQTDDPYSLENIDRMLENDSTAEIGTQWSSQVSEAPKAANFHDG